VSLGVGSVSGYVTRDGRTIDAVEDATELVGDTPLIALESAPNLFAKLESHNPYSVKDRIAREMVDRAEATGRLPPDGTLVEATSGNTGIGVAFVAAVRGYDCVLVVPSSASRERRQLARGLGANVEIVDGGVSAARERAAEIVADDPGAVRLSPDTSETTAGRTCGRSLSSRRPRRSSRPASRTITRFRGLARRSSRRRWTRH
jgi:cysteine synthase A